MPHYAGCLMIVVWDLSNLDKTSLFEMVKHIHTILGNHVHIASPLTIKISILCLCHDLTHCCITFLNQNPT